MNDTETTLSRLESQALMDLRTKLHGAVRILKGNASKQFWELMDEIMTMRHNSK